MLFFYRRIFRGKAFDIITSTLIGFVIVWILSFFFAILFRCGTNFWSLWAPLEYLIANCYNIAPVFEAFTVTDVITDGLILTIPIYYVSATDASLNMRSDEDLDGQITNATWSQDRLIICVSAGCNVHPNPRESLSEINYYRVVAAGIARLVIIMQQEAGKLN